LQVFFSYVVYLERKNNMMIRYENKSLKELAYGSMSSKSKWWGTHQEQNDVSYELKIDLINQLPWFSSLVDENTFHHLRESILVFDMMKPLTQKGVITSPNQHLSKAKVNVKNDRWPFSKLNDKFDVDRSRIRHSIAIWCRPLLQPKLKDVGPAATEVEGRWPYYNWNRRMSTLLQQKLKDVGPYCK